MIIILSKINNTLSRRLIFRHSNLKLIFKSDKNKQSYDCSHKCMKKLFFSHKMKFGGSMGNIFSIIHQSYNLH